MGDRRPALIPPHEAAIGLLAGLALLFLGSALQMAADPAARSLAALADLPLFWALLGAPVLVGGLGWIVGDRRRERDEQSRLYQATVEAQFAEVTEREWVTRAVVQNSFDAVFLLDTAGAVLDANPMASRIFGHPLDVLVGRSIGEMLPDHHRLQASAAVERRTAGGERLGLEWRTRARHADGTTFPVDLHVSMLPEPGLVVYAVREASTSVEHEKIRVREALESHEGRVVLHQRRRGILLLDVDHGLRDALVRLLASAEALRDVNRPEVEDLVAEGHAILDRLELLWNVTMWERSAGEPTLVPVPVNDLFERVRDALAPMARRHGSSVELVVSDAGAVLTDGNQLAGAVRSLCVEALRRSPGVVKVEVVREPGRDTDWLSVFVACEATMMGDLTDEGLARAFQWSEEVMPRSDVGLALAQRLARRLGGHVSVDAEPGRPLGFSLRVPVDPTRAKRPRAKTSERPRAPTPT